MNSLGLCFFPMSFSQLIVNCWFGARWFGFLESPKMKGIGIPRCSPIRIQNHRAPNQQLTTSWFSMSQQITPQLWPIQIFNHLSRPLPAEAQSWMVIGSFHPQISQTLSKTRWWFQTFFNIFYFHPYLGKIPILTNFFQMGWNHQLEKFLMVSKIDRKIKENYRPFDIDYYWLIHSPKFNPEPELTYWMVEL